MLKNFLNLKGVKLLSKNQLEAIHGGYTCTIMGGAANHQYLYSGGEIVGEACRWSCTNGTQPWGGCPFGYE